MNFSKMCGETSQLEVIIRIADGKKKNPKPFKVELIFPVEVHYCFMLLSVIWSEHTFACFCHR